MRQILILCEGYDDRAFWKCWLLRLGATDLWLEAGSRPSHLKELLRAAGVRSVSGDFCVRNCGGDILVIRPCKSDNNLWPTAEAVLHDGVVDRLIVSCDSDQPDSEPEPAERRIQQLDNIRGTIPTDLVVWHCDDAQNLPGVPIKQTLERLICAAIAAGQPAEWKTAVEKFLRDEPIFGPNHKNFAHAYWAKFFAHDFDDLYSAVWSQVRFPAVAQQLEERLRRNGDWDRIAALVAG